MVLGGCRLVVAFAALGLAAGFLQPARAATDEQIAAITGAILQADGPTASHLLATLPDTQLDTKDRGLRACMAKRLSSGPADETVISPVTGQPDPFAADVLKTYRSYWRTAVMNPKLRDAAEQKLRTDLVRLLHLSPTTTMDNAEQALASRLERSGFHSLEGRTGLLREFMLWSKQESKTYRVSLPEGSNETRVFFMDRFASMGWSSYLTCDRTGTGGWTKPDGLYVVVPAYSSLTDENFRVNFLAHESQHYLDHKQFPGLSPWELEYRAKLVELAYANETMKRTLLRFASDQGDDPASPHSYADKRVLIAMKARLRLTPGASLADVPVAKLNKAAVAELLADSSKRRAAMR